MPVPATVVMIPLGVTSRITLFPESAMNRSPCASTATDGGVGERGRGGRAAVADITERSIAGWVKIVPTVGAISKVCTLLTVKARKSSPCRPP